MYRYFATPLAGVCALVASGISLPSTASTASQSLRSYVERALQAHPETLVHQARTDQALALAEGASFPLYNPELEIEYEDKGSVEETIGLSQTLDWSDKQSSREVAANARARAFSLEARWATNDLTTQILSAIGQHSVAQRMAGLADRRLELTERFASIATRRYQAGDLPLIENDVAILAATQARFAAAEASVALSDSRQQLEYLTGTSQSPPDLPETLPKMDGDLTVGSLLQVEAAMVREAAAAADFEVATKSRRPDPTLAIRAGRDGDDSLIGLWFSVPLYVRNPYRAEVVAADAAVAEANARASDIERRAGLALTQARTRYQALKQSWTQWQGSARMSFQRQLTTLEQLWTSGELSTAEYLIQISQALETESGVIELEGNVWAAWFEWLTASNTANDWLRSLP